MGGDSGIRARGLRRSFGEVEAVAGMDLDAPAGRVTALVGPNGAGKTTLMLMVVGLLAADAGTISVDGHDPVADSAVVRARVGWMPDALGTWDALSAREHLETYAAAYRLSRSRRAARARELLELVDLASWADSPARVLSRGQKQRLGLARALVHEPSVLVLDEPASGLDPESRVALRDLLRSLAAGGVAVLVSSHVLADLDDVADDAVYVVAGRTVRPDGREPAAGQRWRVRALDAGALDDALQRRGVATEPVARGDGVEVSLDGDESAAQLLAGLVSDGVGVVSFAPLAGRIERTYLSLASGSATQRDQPGGGPADGRGEPGAEGDAAAAGPVPATGYVVDADADDAPGSHR